MNLLGRVNNWRVAMALSSVLSTGSGCAMHKAAQETHLATKAVSTLESDLFTKNKSHALENLKIIKALKALTPEQLEDLLKTPVSNLDELLEALADAAKGGVGCNAGAVRTKNIAEELCDGTDNAKECVEEAYNGVFKECMKPINGHLRIVIEGLQREASLNGQNNVVKSHALENIDLLIKNKILTISQIIELIAHRSSLDEIVQAILGTAVGRNGCLAGAEKVKTNMAKLCNETENPQQCIDAVSQEAINACLIPITDHFQAVSKR